jgi:hypothetical protein
MLAALAASACTKDEPAEVPTLVASAPAPEKRGAAGSREEKPEYVVELLAPEAAASGAKRAAVVHVVADEVDGLHFEDKKIPLTDAAEKTACRAEPKDTCEVRAKVPFTAEKAATLSGLVAFSICQSGQCLIKKVRLAVDVPPP